jgi:hypothetical protein
MLPRMGRLGSPLRDKVIFVEGAPRSGTTWLVRLLAAHPRIAGVSAESHLFDNGVDKLFDNIEQRSRYAQGLIHYLDREELVDAVRDLCDRVFLGMRDHLGCDPAPDHIVEKTPVVARHQGRDLERKHECYPDAWCIHVVRDREAVARSLMKSPFVAASSYEECLAMYDGCVGNIRRTFGQSPRYREVRHEDLLADPAAGCADLFGWIGLETSEQTLATVATLARERVSEVAAPAPAKAAGRARRLRRALPRPTRRRRAGRPAEPSALDVLSFGVVRALRRNDAEALRALTHPQFAYVLRSPGGDVELDGDEARDAFIGLAKTVFARRHIGQWWAGAPAAPAEWWSSAPGQTFWSVMFSTLNGDASRADVALGCTLEDDLLRRVVAIAAGPLEGRPVAPEPAVAMAHATS